MDEVRKKQFKFSDTRQERIHKFLLELNAETAGFFMDACEMLEEVPPKKTKQNLIAHCMREVMGAVLNYALPRDFAEKEKIEDEGKLQKEMELVLKQQKIEPKSKAAKIIYSALSEDARKNRDSHSKKVKAILVAYEIDPESEIGELWLRTADRNDKIAIYNFVHRNNLGERASKNKAFLELWDSLQAILDGILPHVEGNYGEFIKVIDEVLKKDELTNAEIKTLKENVPNRPVTNKHLYENLENQKWLEPLQKAGFFSIATPAVPHPDGGYMYPFWHQATFLKKMAVIPKKQQTVLEICISVETDNPRAINEIVEIAMMLPIDMGVQIAENIDKIDDFLSAENYGKLILHLAENGKISEACSFARKVLAFKPDPRPTQEIEGYKFPHDPVSLIRDYDYEGIIEKIYPSFVDAAGIEAVKVLLDKMQSYINISDESRKEGSKDDYSEIWRSAIEDHPQNHKYGLRDSLVTGIRDACERLLSKDSRQMNAVLKELEMRNLLLFKRLEMHLLRLYPQNNEKKIAEVLMNPNEFDHRQRLTHEYFLLAEQQGKVLSEKQKQQLWLWIENGGELEKEEFEEICQQRGIEPTEEVADKYKKFWQLYHLLPFKDVDPKWGEFLEQIKKVTGEPEFPSFRSWSSGLNWGFKSSITDQEFKKNKPEEIVEKLKKWQPEEIESPLGVSREGTSRVLSTHIAEEPEKWSATLSSFSELDPTFARSVLSGHRDAIRNGKTFDWKPLLSLGEAILKKPIAVKERVSSGFYGDDPDWSWSRRALVDLVTEGMRNKIIPLEYRQQVWNIIHPVISDPHPSPDETTQLIENNEDPLTAAINTTRGDAIEGAIQYGIWLKDSLVEEKGKEWTLTKDAPELKIILEERLDINNEPFIGIRAVYGERLGALVWMDRKWVEENVEKIFPSDPKDQELFDAAWESFMIFNGGYNEFLEIFEKQYERAINEVGHHSKNKHYLANPDEMLGQQLLMFYLRGKINFEEGLLQQYYEKASIKLRASLIDFIGRRAGKLQTTVEDIEKICALAEKRITEIKKSQNPNKEIEEFQDFSWWIESEKFDDKWTLGILIQALELGCDIEGDHLILERYQTLVAQYPLEVIISTDLMIQNDKKGWGVPTWGDDLKNIIRAAIDSGNDEAVKHAKTLAHKLIAKGHDQYKEFI